MEKMYRRFWFEFEISNAFKYPPGIGIGLGVTALSFNDAVELMDAKVFLKVKRPPFKKVIEDVDIRTLDQGHVIPNMKPVIFRGIWFPLGYD